MAGRTISAYVDAALAERVEHLAAVEDRKVSQLTAAALALYTLLPPEAHTALRRIEVFGEPEDLAVAAWRVTRVLLDVQYEIAERSVVESMDTSGLGDLESEEEVLAAATWLVERRREPGGRLRRPTKPAEDGESSPRAGRQRRGASARSTR